MLHLFQFDAPMSFISFLMIPILFQLCLFVSQCSTSTAVCQRCTSFCSSRLIAFQPRAFSGYAHMSASPLLSNYASPYLDTYFIPLHHSSRASMSPIVVWASTCCTFTASCIQSCSGSGSWSAPQVPQDTGTLLLAPPVVSASTAVHFICFVYM